MYHPGKVIEIFAPDQKSIKASDSSAQAMLEMWDDNILTVAVDQKLVKALKKADIVLVDYTTPNKLQIIKILRGEIGANTWAKYKDQYKRKLKELQMQRIAQMKASGQALQPYVG
jgi:hypothetical protein